MIFEHQLDESLIEPLIEKAKKMGSVIECFSQHGAFVLIFDGKANKKVTIKVKPIKNVSHQCENCSLSICSHCMYVQQIEG